MNLFRTSARKILRRVFYFSPLFNLPPPQRLVVLKQCCGSGSTFHQEPHSFAVFWILIRSVCMFLDLPDPNSSLFVRIRILWSSSKNSEKNLDFYYLWLLDYLLYLKKDVNVPAKSNKPKNLETYVLLVSWKKQTKRAGSGSEPGTETGSGSVSQWFGPTDPDPYQIVTDQQHGSFINF